MANSKNCKPVMTSKATKVARGPETPIPTSCCQAKYGLLGRLHVHVLYAIHIGKETNLLEEQEKGNVLTDPQEVYRGGGEWGEIRSWLDRVSIAKLATLTGLNARTLRCYRQGTRKPPPEKLEAIAVVVVQMLDED